MFSGRTRLTLRHRTLLLTVVAALAGTTAGLALDDDRDGAGPAVAQPRARAFQETGSCGAASTAVIASVDEAAASRIYAGELHGGEARVDVAHVTQSQALLSAVANANSAGIQRAVHALVYAPRWHIVRLRVLRGGNVMSDVGGPYVIAPIKRPLRWHGRRLGSFVMSVQDDVGFVKLVARFIGVPIGIYKDRSFVMGTVSQAPRSVSSGATVTIAGSSYRERVLTAKAFPTGSLRIVLFVRPATGAIAAQSCARIRGAAWGSVAARIAARFKPLAPHFGDFVDVVRSTTDGFALVRSGSKRIAGGPGPAKLPFSGTVNYQGRSWTVYSFEPAPKARVYVLSPAK
jgi:hypothetical protein